MKEQHDIEDTHPNTYGRSEITCPHCGNEWGDSWEINSDNGERTCDRCGKKYRWSREVTVKYESSPIDSNVVNL